MAFQIYESNLFKTLKLRFLTQSNGQVKNPSKES